MGPTLVTVPAPAQARDVAAEPNESANQSHRRGSLLTLVVIVGAGLALRFYPLSARSFWFDEGFSWRLAQFPFWEMLDRTAQDNHPPLYFMLLKAWGWVFGTSAFALRSLSAALGGLTIVAVYLFAVEALDGSRRTALLAAALVAASVFQLRWSTEVRMYTLGTVWAALSSWALFRALRPGAGVRPWLGYGLLCLLFLYTHYYALFSIAAQGLYAVGLLLARAGWRFRDAMRDPHLGGAVAAVVIVGLGFLPWLPTFLAQRAQVQGGYWLPPAAALTIPNACYGMLLDPEGPAPVPARAVGAAVLCAGILLALLWKARAGDWYLFTAALAPPLLSLAASRLDTNSFSLRYLLFANLFFLTGLAVLVGRVRGGASKALSALLLAGFLFVDGHFWNKLDVAHRSGARGAAEAIGARRQPGEPVIVSSPLFFFSVLFHLGDRSGCYLYHEGKEVPHYQGRAALAPGDLIAAEALKDWSGGRAWVVNMGGGHWGTETVPVPAGWVEVSRQAFPDVYWFQGEVIVVEYEVTNRSG